MPEFKKPKAQKPMKWTLVVMNGFFVLLAIVMFIVGLVSIQKLNIMADFVSTSLPAGVIVIGIVFIYVSLVGCLGAFKMNSNVLLCYLFVLWALIVSEFAIVWVTSVYQTNMTDSFSVVWDHIQVTDRDYIQLKLDCCGFWNTTDRAGPFCTIGTYMGCGTALQNWWNDTLTNLGILAFLVGFLQIIALGLTITTLFCLGACSDEEGGNDDESPSDPYGIDYMKKLASYDYIVDLRKARAGQDQPPPGNMPPPPMMSQQPPSGRGRSKKDRKKERLF